MVDIAPNPLAPEVSHLLTKLNLELVESLAEHRGRPRFRLRCLHGHVFDRSQLSLKVGYGCTRCAQGDGGRVRPAFLTHADLATLAARQGGCSLHDGEIGSRMKLRWRCSVGHEFLARADNVRQGSWCPSCRNCERWTLQRVAQALQGRGITCLSAPASLGNNKSRLTWQCLQGHRWETSLVNIIYRESGCPYCQHRAEQYCREDFNELFGAEFPRVRPVWLRPEGGQPLELDGYNANWRLAFEYQGAHHYEEVPYFKHGPQELARVVGRDAFKRERCDARGVTLLQVPRYPRDCFSEVRFKGYIEEFVMNSLAHHPRFAKWF
jgi:hypothetical protein